MAVIQTAQGRIIGLVVNADQPKTELDAEKSVFAEEAQERKRPGRPKKS